jgi:protein-S-isoprenylcysteine O-methyltransferase Ste14
MWVDMVATAVVLIAVGFRVSGQAALGESFTWGSSPAAHQIVDRGPYRWLKHPLLLGYGLECLGLLAMCRGFLALRVTVLVVLAVALVSQAADEERRLAARFGDAWATFSRGKPL